MVRAKERDCLEDIGVRPHEIITLLFSEWYGDGISRGEQKELM